MRLSTFASLPPALTSCDHGVGILPIGAVLHDSWQKKKTESPMPLQIALSDARFIPQVLESDIDFSGCEDNHDENKVFDYG